MDDQEIKRLTKKIRFSAFRYGIGYLADDCVQEILLRMLEGRHKGATTDQCVVDYRRKHHGQRDGVRLFNSPSSYEGSGLDNFFGKDPTVEIESKIDVWKLIGNIGDRRKRKLAEMYYIEGCSLDEIGKALGVTESRICQLIKDIHADIEWSIINRSKSK